jgi:anthranilate phosphoribosyltransferase
MRMAGERPEQIEGFARIMRANCITIPYEGDDLVDTCGTGGDAMDTFNISTAAALVAAGAGVKIAKHGNRSVSSQCGSADVLMELGVDIDLEPQEIAECIDEHGLGFLFAPHLHPAMKHAIGPRRELGMRTVFNVLGPLTNPAGATRQLLGVFAPELTDTLAHTLAGLGSEHALIVHGLCGMDELSTLGPTQVSELNDGVVRTYALDPSEFGFKQASPEDLAGGDPAYSAQVIRDILDGRPGPKRDIVEYNAGAAIYVGGRAEDIAGGIQAAGRSIDSGAARDVLKACVPPENTRSRR